MKKTTKTEIHIAPALRDNYIYILRSGNRFAAVDPGEAVPVLKFFQKKGGRLDFIWNTHHHYDHTGGNLELKRAFGCSVYGFEGDRRRVPGLDRGLRDGESFLFGEAEVKTIFIPGHTLGHIAFYLPKEKRLFCGDTLFGLGCGRLFEGTAQDLFKSLGKLKQLPEETLVYCGHEYTEANGEFVLSLKQETGSGLPSSGPRLKSNKPESNRRDRSFWENVKKRMKKVRAARARRLPTVPFSLKDELETNPFLRAASAAELGELRKQKDEF